MRQSAHVLAKDVTAPGPGTGFSAPSGSRPRAGASSRRFERNGEDMQQTVEELKPLGQSAEGCWPEDPSYPGAADWNAPLTGVDLEWEQQQERFRLEAEAAKTPAQREAETVEREASLETDAWIVGASLGVPVRRPGGEWLTAEQHRARAERLQQSAESLRKRTEREASVADLRARARASSQPAVPRSERRAQPREHRSSSSSTPRRGPPQDSDDDPSPLARCGQCGEPFSPARRDAKFCGGACKQAAYRRRQRPKLPDVVWRLRADGEIDELDAARLLITPAPVLLAAARPSERAALLERLKTVAA
jgi:hypothetical protein